MSLAAEDVNGDHHVDLAVALRNDKVKVFVGNGKGELRHGAQYEHGDTPTSVALSDLNGDGKMDLVVTNGGPMSNAVSVWLGNGDGTFRDPKDYHWSPSHLLLTRRGISCGTLSGSIDHNMRLGISKAAKAFGSLEVLRLSAS